MRILKSLPILFTFHLIIALTFVLALVLQFKSIPGPPYGGDYYFHNGITEAIFYGTPVFRDPTNYNGYAFYPWLYHAIVALVSKTGIEPMRTMTYVMPPLILIFSSIVIYHLLKELYGRRVAVVAPIIVLSLGFPDPHPHTFLAMVTLPIFYLSFIKYLRKPTFWRGALLGVAWGISGLTHVLGTFGAGAIIVANIIWDLISTKKHQSHFEKMERSVSYWTSRSYALLGPIAVLLSRPHSKPLPESGL